MDSEIGDPPGYEGDDDKDEPEAPLTAWQSISDVVRGLLALLLFSVAVLVLYVAGGVFLGLLAWAAPAVLALALVVILARYLSRMK